MSTQQRNLLPLVVAVKRVTGIRRSPTTCYRWAFDGRKGIKLKTKMLGGRRLTTNKWVREFINEVSQASGKFTADAKVNGACPKRKPDNSQDIIALQELKLRLGVS